MSEGLKKWRIITDNAEFYKAANVEDKEWISLPNGKIACEQLRQLEIGSWFEFKGKSYCLLECDLQDYIMEGLQRWSQIIYPKDAGYMLARMDIFPGKYVGEAGTGSGAFTLALSRSVGKEGKVFTYESNRDNADIIRRNLENGKEYDNIIFYNRPVEEGIEQTQLDAFFLDLKKPWEVIDQVYTALKGSGHVGVFVPTTNQISETMQSLKQNHFMLMEITEIFLRNYKLNPERIRPRDRMVAHTGFFILARKTQPQTEETNQPS